MVAMFGGLIVLIGLWMEYKSEKNGQTADELFKDVNDFRLQKSLAKCGERIVMVGILWEIITAGIFAWRGDWEIRQAKINEAKILNKTPGKMPVFTATAFVTFEVEPNGITSNKWSSGNSALLIFFKANENERIAMVSTSNPRWWGPPAAPPKEISMEFSPERGDGFIYIFTHDESADDVLDDLTNFSFQPAFLHDNTKILGGSLTLVLNGSVAKKFAIPPQTFSPSTFHDDIHNF